MCSRTVLIFGFSFLLALQSYLDDKGLKEVTDAAKKILNAMNKKEYKLATVLWSKAEDIIEEVMGLFGCAD